MIRQKLYIDRYDWLVYCFFANTKQDAPSIMRLLDTIGINDEQYERASEHLHGGLKNSGMTYGHTNSHISVMVIGETTTPAETLNTFSHELRHLVDDISRTSNIESSGEEVAYLTGYIALALASSLLYIACQCPICSRHQCREQKQTP